MIARADKTIELSVLTDSGNGKATSPAGKVAEAITGRSYLSHSQVSMYQACRLKFHFAYVEKAPPESVSAAMLLGSGVHAAIEKHLEAVITGDAAPSLDELMQAYEQAWAGEAGTVPIQYGVKDTYESLTTTARNILEAFLESPHAKPTGEIIGIEEQLRISLSEDLPDLLARVDLIERVGDELVITDFKTARSMWSTETADEHADQLLLYGHAAGPIAEELGTKVQLRFVVLTKAKAPRVESFHIPTNEDRVARTTKIVRSVFASMVTGIVYPSPSALNCATCAYTERCRQWHRG